MLAGNPVEYKIVYTLNTKKDKKELMKYIKHRIKSDVEYKAKYYFNLDFNLDDLNIIIQKEDIRLVDYKDDTKKFQAAFLKFASNYSLPRFVGYRVGLGWGEILNQKI
jgi:hypothetical protein